LVSEAIARAVEKSELPKGVFSAVHGGIPASQALVTHPRIKAVGFTGSLQGGKALMELASKRTEPIPVYAEMGSVNPLFILPSALKDDISKLATTLANSVNLGAGQFCTNPGLMVFQKSPELDVLLEELSSAFLGLNPQTMLNEGIYKHFKHTKSQILSEASVTTIEAQDEEESWNGYPAIGRVDASDFIQNDTLHQEVFGPFTLAIICENQEEMKAVAESIEGQLTGTVMGSEQEIEAARGLVNIIAEKVGRIIFNGVPTGVEVSHAMHHSGPFPASSNGMYTSVGTDAILRYARPVCYQNAPDSILPGSLKRSNPLGIWRKFNGELTKK
jgi:NADP-dependent aldehyde dehydrogenase